MFINYKKLNSARKNPYIRLTLNIIISTVIDMATAAHLDKIPKILIVEDNPIDLAIIVNVVSKQISRDIRKENFLSEAIEAVKRERFDVVLLDLSLNDSKGKETVLRMRSANSRIPIVVITSSEDEDLAIEALKSGAQDYVLKNQLSSTVLNRAITYSIERQNLFTNLEEKAEELEKLNEINRRTALNFEQMAGELLKKLSLVSQERDHITGAHTERVGIMSEILSVSLGFPCDESLVIRQTAPLHDIGKVGIPDSILQKPARLDPDEWDLMKKHTIIGYNLLRESIHPTIHRAAVIALSHHEKWDGSGYPNRQKGEEIPVEGQIVSIIDVFDALTSERPYKKAWSFQNAFDYIENQRGISFSPEIVKAFISVKEKISLIKNEF